MIGIIDYGLGNIKAISNIYDKLKVKNLTKAKFKSEEEDINLIFNQVKNRKNIKHFLY